eukprot:9652782-Ditylum_brightwellii.AAC.1
MAVRLYSVELEIFRGDHSSLPEGQIKLVRTHPSQEYMVLPLLPDDIGTLAFCIYNSPNSRC